MISVNDWFMSERDAMMTRGKKVSEDGWPRGLKGGGGTGEGMDNTQNQSRPWMMPLKLASLDDCLGWGALYTPRICHLLAVFTAKFARSDSD